MTQKAYANGQYVASFLNNGDVPEERIQPNGVDLGFDEIYRTSGYASLGTDGYEKPTRRTMLEQEDDQYRLYPGRYIVVYDYEVKIPDGWVGRVFPRSRVMRCGLHLTSALWDSGYEGVGEGQLIVPEAVKNVKVDPDVALGQMSFLSADVVERYDGDHNRERIEAE